MVDGGDQPPAPDARDPEQDREPPAQAERRRRPLVGYLAAAALVLTVAIVAIAVLAGGDGESASGGPDPDAPLVRVDEDDLLPDGGVFATPQQVESVEAAAEAAECDLKSFDVPSRDHIARVSDEVEYSSNPPTSGRHFPIPAADAAYEDSPNVKLIVHSLEHSRVVVWFQPELTREQRAALKAFYDHDEHQLLLVPDTTDMPYEVAASAWNAKPKPNGTGRLLGCSEYSDEMFTALEAFKDAHRGKGPEKIP